MTSITRLLTLAFLIPLSLFAADKTLPTLADKPIAKPAKPKPGPDVLVVADVMPETDAEKAALIATAENPIDYYTRGKKEEHIGTPYANDPMPKPEEVEAELVKMLAKQHYLRSSKPGDPAPQLVILFTWGSANPDIDQFTETDSETGETTTTTTMSNARRMRSLAGIHKAQDQLLLSSEAATLSDAATSDRLYIFVAAMDAAALRKKEKKLLWRTNISIDNRRTTLVETFGTMLASAAPYFGRENGINEYIDDKMRKSEASVTFGELKVLENGTVESKDEKKTK